MSQIENYEDECDIFDLNDMECSEQDVFFQCDTKSTSVNEQSFPQNRAKSLENSEKITQILSQNNTTINQDDTPCTMQIEHDDPHGDENVVQESVESSQNSSSPANSDSQSANGLDKSSNSIQPPQKKEGGQKRSFPRVLINQIVLRHKILRFPNQRKVAKERMSH